MSDPNCVFCKIASGEIPAPHVAEDEVAVAFNDLNPMAPVHVLVVPKAHVQSLSAVGPDGWPMTAHLFKLADQVARARGLGERGYRCVVNTGDEGGQVVQHLHLHVLGGRRMNWPPG